MGGAPATRRPARSTTPPGRGTDGRARLASGAISRGSAAGDAAAAAGPGPEEPAPDLRLSPTARTEAFSDGVFAIAMTLLVLEVHVPSPPVHPARDWLLTALLHQWPADLAYLATFLTIGVIWLNHHAVFQKIRGIDRTLQWWNLLLLLFVSFSPFPNALMAEFLPGGVGTLEARVAVTVYALVFAAATVPWVFIWRHLAARPDMLEPGFGASYARREVRRSMLGLVVYSVGIVVAALVPLVAVVLFIGAAAFYAATAGGSRGEPE